MSKTAHIICIASGDDDLGFKPRTGYNPKSSKELFSELEGKIWVGPRQTLEKLEPIPNGDNPSYPRFIQIIPYYLFESEGKYLKYERTTSGSEGRLHGKISIGIGGHVDLADAVINENGEIDLQQTLTIAGKREGMEEFGFQIEDENFEFNGLIYATDAPVDTVHVGIVGICRMSKESAEKLRTNDEIGSYDFKTFDQIKAEVHNQDKSLETWTRLIIESGHFDNGEVA